MKLSFVDDLNMALMFPLGPEPLKKQKKHAQKKKSFVFEFGRTIWPRLARDI
jgi:hypothetical protein